MDQMRTIDEKSRDHQSFYDFLGDDMNVGTKFHVEPFSCQDISLKNRNVNLIMTQGGKSDVPQSQRIHHVGTINTKFLGKPSNRNISVWTTVELANVAILHPISSPLVLISLSQSVSNSTHPQILIT